MPESPYSQEQVAILFHTDDDHLFIPPFEIPVERRDLGETYEKTFYRLAAEHGVQGYSSGHETRFTVLDENDEVIRGYLLQPRYSELDNDLNEFLIPLDEVHEHLARESGLSLRSRIDTELVLAARHLLMLRRPLD